MCVSDANTVRTPAGDAAMCTFSCGSQPRACVAGDGVCPAACNPRDDADCRGQGGSMCRDGGDCLSNSCNRNGRCCAEACGVCQDCMGPTWACQNVPQGMPAPGCGDTQGSNERCSGDGRCVRPAMLVVEPAVGLFGMVPVRTTKDLRYTIRNVGAEDSGPLMSRVTGSPRFTIVAATQTCGPPLAPNASCTVDVRFAPLVAGMDMAELEITAMPGGRVTAAARGTATAPPR